MMTDFFSSQISSPHTIKMMRYTYLKLYIFYSVAPKVRLKSQSKYVINPELSSSRRVLYENWTVPLLNLPEPTGPLHAAKCMTKPFPPIPALQLQLQLRRLVFLKHCNINMCQ